MSLLNYVGLVAQREVAQIAGSGRRSPVARSGGGVRDGARGRSRRERRIRRRLARSPRSPLRAAGRRAPSLPPSSSFACSSSKSSLPPSLRAGRPLRGRRLHVAKPAPPARASSTGYRPPRCRSGPHATNSREERSAVNDEELLAELRNAARRGGGGRREGDRHGARRSPRRRVRGPRRRAGFGRGVRRLSGASGSRSRRSPRLQRSCSRSRAPGPSPVAPPGLRDPGHQARTSSAAPTRCPGGLGARGCAAERASSSVARRVTEPVVARVFALRGALPVEVAAEASYEPPGVHQASRARRRSGGDRARLVVFVVTGASSALRARSIAAGSEPVPVRGARSADRSARRLALNRGEAPGSRPERASI